MSLNNHRIRKQLLKYGVLFENIRDKINYYKLMKEDCVKVFNLLVVRRERWKNSVKSHDEIEMC